MTTSDLDPSDGALYSRKVRMFTKNHLHHYEFTVPEGIVRLPSSGEIQGPFINDTFAVHWNFETDSHKVSATGCWEWGVPTSGPGAAHSGTKLWATTLAGNYPNNNSARLLLDKIDLSGHEHPFLQFWCWYSFEARTGRGSMRDAVIAKIVNSAGDTFFINPIYEYPRFSSSSAAPAIIAALPVWSDNDAGNFWHIEQFDLSPWSGDTIQMRFDFGSNNFTTAPGFYFDDIALITECPFVGIVAFSLNGADTAILNLEATERGQYAFSPQDDTIRVHNMGTIPLDLGMKLLLWDTIYFAYSDSSCYGCFYTWAQFTDTPASPDSISYISANNALSDTMLIFADDTLFGPAGSDLAPSTSDYLWFMVRTPEYFPQDSLFLKVLIKSAVHLR